MSASGYSRHFRWLDRMSAFAPKADTTRAAKRAQRRAHQNGSGSSDVLLSAAEDRRWSVFDTLTLTDRGSDLLVRFGQ
jgi:hypothetical protein